MTSEQKPEILMTGAGGELAHHVYKKMKKNYHVVGIDFREKSRYDDGLIQYRLDFSKRGFEAVFREHNFQGILHLGRVRLSQSNVHKRYNINVLGTQKLLGLGLKYGVQKTVVLSTFHVYGAHPYNPSLIDESFPLKASNLSNELVDSVELENLITIHMLRHPESKTVVLRPCNILGAGVNNQVSLLLQRKHGAPILMGYSPLMQFIHVDDVATAIVKAYEGEPSGVFNVAPNDWIPYTKALELAGAPTIHIPSIPPFIARQLYGFLKRPDFPVHLINFYKYSVILDGNYFAKTFDFKPQHTLEEMFEYYRHQRDLR